MVGEGVNMYYNINVLYMSKVTKSVTIKTATKFINECILWAARGHDTNYNSVTLLLNNTILLGHTNPKHFKCE